MTTKRHFLFIALALFVVINQGAAQGTAFSYQGRLNDGGNPATGLYDVRFTVLDAPTNGNLIAGPITNSATGVTNGLFTVTLDFGPGVFTGSALWLELDVQTNGGGAFTTLLPLQPIQPVPYAMMANTASNLLGALPTTQLSGTVPLAQLPGVVVTNNATDLSLSGAFRGNGAGLTNLSLAHLAAGVLTNKQSGVIFGGLTTVSNLSVTATNFVNYLVVSNPPALNGSAITNLNASQLSSGAIPLAQLPTAVVTNNASKLTIGGTNVVAPLTVPTKVPIIAIGSVAINGPESVAVVGRYAYVATYNTLQIFDVSTPSAPVSVGSVGTGSGPYSVAVAGRYAYVVNASASTLQIFDVSTPSAPVSVGSVGTGKYPQSVAVSGRYAYLVNSNATLQVFDVSLPTAPVLIGSVGTGSMPASVAVSGRYAFVSNYGANTLQVFDVSNPSAPVSIGSVGTGSGPLTVAMAGRYAYVVNSSANTLQIFDVSNPSTPVSVGSVGAGSRPEIVTVAGRYAYVINSSSNTLQVFDVSTPSAPISVGSVGTGSWPISVAVSGRYAYVVNANGNTLQVFDLGGAYVQQFEAGTMETGTLQTRDTVTVGNNINVSGGLTVSGSARISGGLSVDNGTITATSFVGSGGSLTNLNASQVTSGTLPLAQLPGAVVTNNSVMSVTLSGTFSGNGAGLSNMAVTMIITNLPSGTLSNNQSGVVFGGLTIVSNLSVTATNYVNYLVVSNPPALNGSAITNLNASQLSSGLIPLAQLPTSVMTNNSPSQIIDGNTRVAPLTVPEQVPTGICWAQIGARSRSVALVDRYAYVVNGTSNTLQVFDLSTPSSPVLIGSVSGGNNLVSIAVAGRYAYVASYGANKLQIFDVSTPSSPVSVGSVSTSSGPLSIAVAGRYAYVVNASASTLQVFDVSTPSAPVLIGTVGTGGSPWSVAVAGRYAYVVNEGSSTLQIFDVSTPWAPISVSSVGTVNYPTFVAVSGRYAYVVNQGVLIGSSPYLQIIDVSKPSAPVSVGSVSTGNVNGDTSFVAVAGRYAYVLDNLADSLQIFDVSKPSSPSNVSSVGTGIYWWAGPTSMAVSGRYGYVVNQSIPFTFVVFDMGGSYLQQLEAGAMETGTLQTRDTVTVGKDLNVRGDLTIGGSAQIAGGLSVNNILGGITTNILIDGHTFYYTNGFLINIQ